MLLPSQIDAVTSRARASLAAAGLTVIGQDLTRPWGGFLLISQSDVQEFIGVYFPDAGLRMSAISWHSAPAALGRSRQAFVVAVSPQAQRDMACRRGTGRHQPISYRRGGTDAPLRRGRGLRLKLGERHRLVGLKNWGVIAEIWQHLDASSPSDEHDIVASPTITSEPDSCHLAEEHSCSSSMASRASGTPDG